MTITARTGKTAASGKSLVHLWYDVNIPGSVQDPSKNNWYKLSVPVTYALDGDVFFVTETNTFLQQALDFKQCTSKSLECRDSKTKNIGHFMYVKSGSKCLSKCIVKASEKHMKEVKGWECGKCRCAPSGLRG